jgi:hypothetical protein
MPGQEAVTVRAPVGPGRLPGLTRALDASARTGGHPGSLPACLPLGNFAEVHFARLFLLEAATLHSGERVPESLVYMADVDGSVEGHLCALVDRAAAGVDELFGHCEGYPDRPDRSSRLAWLREHSLAPAAYYVHTVGRTVGQIKDEARLFQTLQTVLDSGEVVTRGADPVRLRSDLRAAVLRRSDFSWATRLPAGPGPVRQVRDALHLYASVVGLLLVAPFALLPALVWLVLVRMRELTDRQEDGVPDLRHVEQVRRYEDFGAQNPFTAVGEVKPGLVRGLTMRVAVAGLGLFCRHAAARDNLAGVTSIHFARWVPIDDGRRLIFASSYDGSLESYMDDFISRLSWGINLVFGNGSGFPRTRWLVLGGARDEIRYKHYLRRHQVPTPAFYSAYPQSSAPDLDRFSSVRLGLRDRDPARAASWLAQL